MTLSDEARDHLDRYLEGMRASMPGTDNESIAEIEQDIRAHVEAELGERHGPISAHDLDAVLDQLGNPTEWVLATAAAPPTPVRLGGSVEDWVAGASIGLLLLGFALPFLIPVSWISARWALARVEQRGENFGPRRWLLYPPLAVICIVIVLLALFWPFGAFAELGTIAAQRIGVVPGGHFPPLVTVGVAFACLGAYWILIGAACALAQRAVRFLLHPFADALRRKHALRLSATGAIVLLLSGAAAFLGSR